jgi:hypothetical protein
LSFFPQQLLMMPISIPDRPARRLAVSLFAVLTASAVVACSDGPTTPSMESIAGAYTIQTVNGRPLPIPTYGSTTDSIVADGYSIDVDGSYSRMEVYRVFAGGRVVTFSSVDSGSVALSGKNITLTTRVHAPHSLQGTIVGDVLTLNNPPDVLVYQRVRIGY